MKDKSEAKNISTQDIIDLIKKLSSKHGISKVFSDFLELSSISISNTCDKTNYEKREKRYLEIIKIYTKQEINIFSDMLFYLIMIMQEKIESEIGPEDILGTIFEKLQLNNKVQVFTPNHICELISNICINNYNTTPENSEIINLLEPCCGSGRMILNYVKELSKKRYNYQGKLLVTAIDIDILCVYMTYIQLSLYGITAKVIHGNSLTTEEWAVWYIPMTYLSQMYDFQSILKSL